MADEWPFINLNTISPSVEELGNSNKNQELSLLPFDPSHLEAWTNITFQFDESNGLFPTSTTSDTTSNTSHNEPHATINHELFHTSSEIHLHAPNDRNLPAFVGSQNMISTSNNTSQISFLDRPSNHHLPNCIDGPINNNSLNTNINIQSAFEVNHQSLTSPSTNKSKQVEDHSSPPKNDPVSPNNHQINGNHGSNDDDVANRIAYDEDKRRRNTLASARFRMKKKMKEQEIERTAKEMKDRVSELEKEVDNLKQENKWLRGLIVDSTASKLVSVQSQETVELNHLESSCNKKRSNPLLALTSDSIGVPNFPLKRVRM